MAASKPKKVRFTTKALVDLMIDYKKCNKTIMQFSCNEYYDLDAPPNVSTSVQFRSREGKLSKRAVFMSNYPTNDRDTIEYIQDISKDVDELRKEIQDWYDCGVVVRQTTHNDVPYPSKEIVKQKIGENIHDTILLDIFLGVLDKPEPNKE
eukprot:scaffold982_cov169-Amphora_coffeaeformis.AAC.5